MNTNSYCLVSWINKNEHYRIDRGKLFIRSLLIVVKIVIYNLLNQVFITVISNRKFIHNKIIVIDIKIKLKLSQYHLKLVKQIISYQIHSLKINHCLH